MNFFIVNCNRLSAIKFYSIVVLSYYIEAESGCFLTCGYQLTGVDANMKLPTFGLWLFVSQIAITCGKNVLVIVGKLALTAVSFVPIN